MYPKLITLLIIPIFLVNWCSKESSSNIPSDLSVKDKSVSIFSTSSKDSSSTAPSNIVERREKTQEETFSTFIARFFRLYQEKNGVTMNEMIHDTYGLFLIDREESRKAIVSRMEKKYFLTWNYRPPSKSCTWNQDTLAHFECGKGWDKEGCFWNSLPEVSVLQRLEDIRSLDFRSGETLDSKDLFREIFPKITHIAGITEYPITFYFSEIEKKWYLSAVNFALLCGT